MFKNVWFKVNSEEHAEAVQKMLFAFDVLWAGGTEGKIQCCDKLVKKGGCVDSHHRLFHNPGENEYTEIDVSWLDPALYREEEPNTVTISKEEYDTMRQKIKDCDGILKWLSQGIQERDTFED